MIKSKIQQQQIDINVQNMILNNVIKFLCTEKFKKFHISWNVTQNRITVPVGAQSGGEMLGCTIHAVNKHSINIKSQTINESEFIGGQHLTTKLTG